MDVFADRHAFNRTSPTSSFRRAVTCQRRHAAGTDVLRGRVLTRTDGAIDIGPHHRIARRSCWPSSTTSSGCTSTSPSRDLAALWSDMTARHEEWLASQQAAA